MKKILVILGPTSTGKTDLTLSLAKRFHGELVACDSRQVYRGLDIGTGKLPSRKWEVGGGRWKRGKGFWEIDGVKVWMYDVVDPKRQYTVFDYVKEANKIIDGILKRGKLPIIVGGTGLYLKALLEGLSNLTIPLDLKLRKKLEKLSLDELQKMLQQVSPKRWGKMNDSDKQNPRRLIRAIEMANSHRLTTPDLEMTKEESIGYRNDALKIGLTAPREILYQRIDERVVSRINQGMIDEAKKLHESGLSFKRMRQLGLEYGVLASFLQGAVKTRNEFIKIMQGKIHGFARRQITWFKREKEVFWLDISNKNYAHKVENLVAKWYDIPKYATKN